MDSPTSQPPSYSPLTQVDSAPLNLLRPTRTGTAPHRWPGVVTHSISQSAFSFPLLCVCVCIPRPTISSAAQRRTRLKTRLHPSLTISAHGPARHIHTLLLSAFSPFIVSIALPPPDWLSCESFRRTELCPARSQRET
ncbi:hypothetical protein DL95DRAFT_72616 [Leptodontidium sp. 2 PMI_412]|nr:hypothetical protein DL95DRAFT_72616 [Leptodontidium sp. 2 PMI_412]